MGAALDQWNNRKKQSQPTTAGRSGSALEVWNNGRPERMQQSINRLDAGMQSLQKQTAARKSYWDGNDQQIRQQAESMNKLMDQIESTSKRYGMADAYDADAMKALRQYNTDVLSVLDAEAEVYGQFKSKTEYDRYVKNYAAQQKRQAAINAENERIGKMSLEELDREIERVQNRQKSFQQENGGFFGEALRTVGRGAVAITAASKGPAKGPEHDPLKETLDNYDRQDKVYSEKINTLKQARYTKLLEPLSAEALSAVDAIIKSRAMQEEQAKANRQINNETGPSSMAVYDHGTMDLETNAITKLEKMGYNNYEELVDARSRIKNAVDYEEEQKEIEREMKEENPVIMPVLANIASVGTQIARGKSAVTDTLTTLIGGDIDIYDANHYAGMFTDTVRGTTQEMIEDQYDSPAAKFAARTAYNVGMSVADNLARMAIGYSAGGIVSPSTVAGVLMGSQVMSQAIVEGKQKGYSDEKAVGMAMVQAAIEAATEKWSVETVLKDSKSVFKQIANSFIAEGAEEVTSNVANYIADALANGDENKLNQEYEAYRRQGMSDKDALTAVIGDVIGENWESFLVGGLSGAVLGAGSAAVYDSRRTGLGQNIIDAKQTDAFIREAERRDDKELNKYLEKVKGKENPSARAVGNLALRLDELGVDRGKIVEKYKDDSKRQTPAEHEAVQTDLAVQSESEKQGISTQVQSEQENDAGRRALMDHAKEYKNTGAEQSFVDNYRAGQDVDAYAAGYYWVYQEGVQGYRFDKVEAIANGEWTNDFTREQAIEAHRAGYMEGMAAVAEPFDEVQLENNETDAIRVADLRPGVTLVNVRDRPMNAIVRTQLAVLQSTGKELGVTFAVVDDYTKSYLNKNGAFLTGGTNKIIVNLDAEGAEIEIDGKKEYLPALLRTAGHESFHWLEEKAPESAEKMRKFVVDHYVKEGKYEALAKRYAAQGYDGMDIDSELTADNLFDVMTQEGFLKKVVRQDAGAVRSIRNTLSTFIRHINKVLSRLTMTNPIHREIYNSLNSDKRFAEKLRRMFTDALESVKNESSNNPIDKRSRSNYNEVKHSSKAQFNKLRSKVPIPKKQRLSVWNSIVERNIDYKRTKGDELPSEYLVRNDDYIYFYYNNSATDCENFYIYKKVKIDNQKQDIIRLVKEIEGSSDNEDENRGADMASSESESGRGRSVWSNRVSGRQRMDDRSVDQISANYSERKQEDDISGSDGVRSQAGKGADESVSAEDGGVKYSFAGSRSQTADHSMLEKARQMEKDGKNSETIRKKTGWFKGYDGKWRYEIDNSKSEFKATGFFTNPAVRRYNELLNEVYFQSTKDESKTQRKLEELQALKKQIDEQGVKKNPRVVGDVLKNKELYDAYPWVQNIPIRFTQMEEDERGAYSQSRQEIVLNSMKRPDVQKRTLLHEIQHLIQDVEGFAKGANLIMYNSTGTETAKGQYLRTAGEIEARDVESRMEYSEEQRKEVRPDIDRTDAIVRLSQKPASSISEEHRALIEENEKYKALIGKLNRHISALQKKVVDPKGVRKLAHDVRAEYQSKIPQAELEQKLTDLFDYIANEQDIDFGSITRAAAEIAKDVIGQSTALNTELTDQYKDMRDRLKTSKIQLTSLQKSEMAVQFDSYENFRRKNFGKIRFAKDGVKLDEMWADLSEAWPEFFKADEHEAEMPLRLMEAIEATNPFHENPYGMNMDEAAYDLALRIYDAYYDIPEVAGLQRQINDLRLEYKEKYKKALQKTRTEYEGKLAEQVARMQRMGLTDTRSRKISQVLQSANALAKKLAANSAKKNVPDALKSPVMAILDSITAYADTERVTSLNKSFMDNLRKAHERFTDLYKDGTDADLTEIYKEHLDITEDFLEEMRRLRRQTDETLEVLDPKAGGHVLQHMDLAQLDALNRVLTQIHHMVMTAGELHRNELYRNANEMASDTIAELSEMKERVAHRFRIGDSVEEFLGWTNATPYYAFKRLGKGGMSIFAEMQKGFDDYAFRIREVYEYARSTYTKKEVRAWEKDVRVLKDATGKEFRLTIPQIMSIYCQMRRDAALQHLLGGGITPGKVGKFQQSQRQKQMQQTLDAIVAELSPRQIEVADKLQEFLSTTCADWGNRVSMKRFGVRLFTEKHYFPMAVDQNTVKSGDTPKLGNGLFDLINRSFTKELNDKASNALYAQDIFDVFTAHATEMAQYGTLALPVLDMMKWYNGMTSSDEQGEGHEKSDRQNVKAEIERVYGKQAQEYIDQFVRDINGITSEDRMRIGKTLMRNFKISKVAANLNVALVQPTAYVRAANVIDPKYLFSALSGMRNLPTHIREMQQYSGIGLWKSMGFFDVDVNRSLATMIKYGDTTVDKIREAGMKGAEVADNMTWGLIFYACQKWAYKEKGLAFGSKACNEAAAEKFREIVYASQVVDSPMTRSALMRSKSGLDQAASAFMSEPTLSYNMLMDQVFEWQKGARSGLSIKENLKKNGKPITRAVATYCMTAVFAAAVEAISGALRDDDDDEFGEKYLDSFIDNLLSDLSIVQKIPGIKYLAEVAQAVLEGKSFSDSNPYTQTFKEFTSAVSALRSGSVYEYKTIYKLLTFISGASGLPVSNMAREVVAMWNATVGAAIPEVKVHRYDVSQKQKIMKIADSDDVRGQTQKLLRDKVDAKRKENPTANVRELEKDARSGLKSSITSAAKEIYQSGDTDKARRLMQQSGLYEAKDIQKNIDKWKAEAALG